uniref:Uncharacterized protein n=1 Tax=Rhizophagus irregularis (strain DAOM 181602 / DAOM 197198 / MUCL 43194) TaxID=747089 RepID=U9TU68_RHIID
MSLECLLQIGVWNRSYREDKEVESFAFVLDVLPYISTKILKEQNYTKIIVLV